MRQCCSQKRAPRAQEPDLCTRLGTAELTPVTAAAVADMPQFRSTFEARHLLGPQVGPAAVRHTAAMAAKVLTLAVVRSVEGLVGESEGSKAASQVMPPPQKSRSAAGTGALEPPLLLSECY